MKFYVRMESSKLCLKEIKIYIYIHIYIFVYICMHACMYVYRASLVNEVIKNLPARPETRVQFLGQEDPLEKR